MQIAVTIVDLQIYCVKLVRHGWQLSSYSITSTLIEWGNDDRN